MRTHGAAGREATAEFVEEFLTGMMAAVCKVRKAREAKARRAKMPKAPKPFKVTGFAPPMAAA